MNIFVTSSDPQQSAQALDDKRVVKMTLETAQLLSSALRLTMGDRAPEDLYRLAQEHHPCTQWALKRDNFRWLHTHGLALAFEYTNRYGKVHKSMHVIDVAGSLCDELEEGRSHFVNCSLHKDWNDVYKAYRETMITKWQTDKTPPTWTHRAPPVWMPGTFNEQNRRYTYNG